MRKSKKKLIRQLIPSELFTITNKQFHFTDEHNQPFTEDTPMLHVTDLIKLTHKILDGYKENGLLTWHKDIPESEIWVKIGGDHGKGSFKLCLQVLNVQNPNSKFMTILIGMAYIKDTYQNLNLFFEVLKQQIESLSGSEWEGKKIRTFLFGDYSFLATLYGLSGAASKHPCLWCHKSSDVYQKQFHNQPHSQPRTLESIHADYTEFVTKGKNDKKNAAAYNNVVNKNLIDIEIEHVAQPSLHILLGVVKKHHTLLERDCDDIDKDIADEIAQGFNEIKFKGNFGDYIRELRCIKHEINQKEGELILIDKTEENREEIKVLEENVEHLYDKVQKLENGFPIRQGPVCSGLDKTLKSHHISLQAYFGRSFIGNHCKKYLTPTVYKDISKQLVRRAYNSTDNVEIHIKAQTIQQKFNHLNELFSHVHRLIAHSQPVSQTSFNTISNSIKKYCRFFRKRFKARVYPKLHFLEDHCLPFIKSFGFGLGLFSEQGGEQLHQSIGMLEQQTLGVLRKRDKLLIILKKHLTQVCPDIFSEEPLIKKRKKSN